MVGACHHKLDIIRNVPFTFFVRYYELIVFCILFYHTFCRRCMLYFCLSQSPLERKLTGTLSLVALGSLIMFLPEIVFCGSWVSSPELVSIFPISLYLHFDGNDNIYSGQLVEKSYDLCYTDAWRKNRRISSHFPKGSEPYKSNQYPTWKSLNIYLKKERKVEKIFNQFDFAFNSVRLTLITS